MGNYSKQGNFNAVWREDEWNNQGNAQWGNQGRPTLTHSQGPSPGFGNTFGKQEERRPAWAKGLMKKLEEIHMDMKSDIKATNQRCEKTFEEHFKKA